jgi:hypothetical protein
MVVSIMPDGSYPSHDFYPLLTKLLSLYHFRELLSVSPVPIVDEIPFPSQHSSFRIADSHQALEF